MPDPIRIVAALAAALLVSTLVPVTWRWLRPPEEPREPTAAPLGGLAAGFYLGCWLLKLWPHWPPVDADDRLLIVVLPVIFAAEVLAIVHRVPRGVVVALRLLALAGTARALLHGSIYLSDAAGPDTRLWTAGEVWLHLAGLTMALGLVWGALVPLGRRCAGFSVPLALAIACGGAGMCLLFSGYASGGQLGLPFAAALCGAGLTAGLTPARRRLTGLIGVSSVFLFGLLVLGHFFGELNSASAGLLLVAPLAAWLPELLPASKVPRFARSLLRVLLVGAIVGGVVFVTARKFAADTQMPGDDGIDGESMYYGG